MIKKIKGLLQIKDEIDKINDKLNNTTESVNNLRVDISIVREQMNKHLTEFNDKNNNFFKNFDENIESMKNIKANFEQEFFDFKLFKSQAQKKILEKFEEELQKELKLNLDNLNKDAVEYKELKNQISNITLKVDNLTGELNKFVNISRNIKEKDFEMKHFAKQLIDMDKEKLDLMRKIDSLERLVSRMRRTV